MAIVRLRLCRNMGDRSVLRANWITYQNAFSYGGDAYLSMIYSVPVRDDPRDGLPIRNEIR